MPAAFGQQVLDGTATIIAPIGGVDTTIGKAHGRIGGASSELQLAALELTSTAMSNLGSIASMQYVWAASIGNDAAWVSAAVTATSSSGGAGKYGITGTRRRVQTSGGVTTNADITIYGSPYTMTCWSVRLGDASGPSGDTVGRLFRAWDNTNKVLIDQWVLSAADYSPPDSGGNRLHLTKLSAQNLLLDFVDEDDDVWHLHEAYALRDKA